MALEPDRRVVIYPCYINSKKTIAEGRRIPVEKACENPHPVEIVDCCNHLKCPAELEPTKCHPRDFLSWRGRVRIKLLDEVGTPMNPEVPNRRALFVKVAELVPKHPNRSKRAQLEREKLQAKEEKEKEATASSSGKVGKSGKKKRK